MPLILNGSTGISGTDGSAGTPALQGTDGNTGMFFPAADQIAFAEGGVEAMRLDASGNVGIGTSVPTSKLHVAGGSGSTIRNTASSGSSWFVGSNVDSYILHNESNTPMLFTTNGLERARIGADGTFFMGQTTNPATATLVLRVATGSANGVNAQITSNTGTSFPWSNYNASGTYVGGISCTSTSTSFPTSSDYRLKENVVPLTDASARVQALKPSRFNFIADPDRTVDGFIAHEAAEVVPEAVHGEKDAVDAEGRIQPQGIDHSKLVPLLTAALQEALTEIAALKARVAALEAR